MPQMCWYGEGGENKVDEEICEEHPAYNGFVGEESVCDSRAAKVLDGYVIVLHRVPEDESSRVESIHDCANQINGGWKGGGFSSVSATLYLATTDIFGGADM